ncbi:hypothetical protein CXB51_031505 [Gossypium anomalum]|uniref:Reverse transcriptase/retrotransposon-derived protein RNase H-like domain-containing protein n=1 Tax=Gossypium anomalum TaxID=47600 RepID=A0A8J5XRB1_9ROSI|nr:hypothetical protein CXB51_031505 [Gossypium anomalum]
MVSMDMSKIDCISSWPLPQLVQELRSFLGLSGYYRRFIRDYGVIARPLTNLLKKNAWGWSDRVTTAFQELKMALCAAPVLALPNFQLEFVVDTDASETGVRAVLQQQGRPVAYFSKALRVRHQALSIYEKEMLAVLLAVRKWHSYLVGRRFKIQTDHQSLRFLSDQVAITLFQQRWVTKMLSYDFEVSYRRGVNNKVQQSYQLDVKLKKVMQDAQQSKLSNYKYSWDGRFLRRKEKIMVGRNLQLWQELFFHFHASAVGGHSGKCKSESVASPGLLQPLPIPDLAWAVVSLDFIEGLPNSNRKNSILVLIDHLTKYAYHPQTDGQTEVLNRYLENYLRCMTGETPANWFYWLPLAEWWYNSSFYSSIRLIPYEALYGQPPLLHMPYLAGASSVAVVDRSLQKSHQSKAISQILWPFPGDQEGQGSGLHVAVTSGALQKEPVRIVDRRIVKKGNQAVTEVLVEWVDSFLGCNLGSSVDLSLEEEEDEGVQFETEARPQKSPYDLYLVGCCLTASVVHFPAVKNTMANLWRPLVGIQISNLGEKQYLFRFFYEVDVEQVMSGTP